MLCARPLECVHRAVVFDNVGLWLALELERLNINIRKAPASPPRPVFYWEHPTATFNRILATKDLKNWMVHQYLSYFLTQRPWNSLTKKMSAPATSVSTSVKLCICDTNFRELTT